MAGKQSLRARIKIRDGNPYVDISRSRARALKPGWRRPLPVLVRVNGQPTRKPWRINLMPTAHSTDSEPQEGNPSIFLVAEIARGARAQRGARDTRVVGQEGPVHGPIVVKESSTWTAGALRARLRAHFIYSEAE